MRIEPEVGRVSVVLLGSFNPAIFTPTWFAWHEILPRSAAEAAQVEVVHRQLTVFGFDWLQLEVSGDRFSVETSLAPHIRVRDLVVRVFKEHLHHTPLKAFGINRSVDFRVRSTGQRDRMGKKLAPAEPWGDCGLALSLGDEGNGLRSLTMTQICPDGRGDGDQINITVEPSKQIEDGIGVYVRVNDHYFSGNAGPHSSEGTRSLIAQLEENFDKSLSRSDGIIDHIMSLAD